MNTCTEPDCKTPGMWHTHPPKIKPGPIGPLPIIRFKPFELPAIFTAQDVSKFHEQAAKDYRRIIKGSQWPQSLKDWCKPLEEQHRFYAWVLSL